MHKLLFNGMGKISVVKERAYKGYVMNKLREAISRIVTEQLYRIIVSKPFIKGELTKVSVRPVMIRGELLFQETRYVGTKVLHQNYEAGKMQDRLVQYLTEEFGQLEAECLDKRMTILTNKKGTVTVREKKKAIETGYSLEHNRSKNHILKDGVTADFLVALGVQMPDGRVVKAKYHKFKQINRYLEFVEDILPALEKDDTIRIVDFGCGKSYLTFALYYYLKIMQNKNIEIIGLDLKKDVIEDCNRLRDRLGYQELRFIQGDIKDYESTDKIDMVVSLHACDTATDYAIAKAVSWGAKVIMAVPCCQHELNRQLDCAPLQEILKYGIIKERIAALITDAYRADCLERMGYETQILEFIDLEHTPKNLLIRAVRTDSRLAARKEGSQHEYKDEASIEELEQYLHIRPLLGQLLPFKKGTKTVQ